MNCNIFTSDTTDENFWIGSTYQMKKLLQKELIFHQNLKIYLKLLQEEVTNINTFLDKSYSKDYNFENLSNKLEEYVSHPINSFGIISRTNMNNLKLSNTICEKLQKLKEIDRPNEMDYFSAAKSVALLQVNF